MTAFLIYLIGVILSWICFGVINYSDADFPDDKDDFASGFALLSWFTLAFLSEC